MELWRKGPIRQHSQEGTAPICAHRAVAANFSAASEWATRRGKIILTMELQSAAGFWVLGLLRSDELPGVAADALEAGIDTPSLRILAGEHHPDVGELDRLFTGALAESQLEMPGRPAAIMMAARYYAERVVSGNMSPIKGASAMSWYLSTIEEAPESLQVFRGLASEYEDFEYRRDAKARRILSEIEQQIVAEARKLVNAP
jgi:hypothetical protein